MNTESRLSTLLEIIAESSRSVPQKSRKADAYDALKRVIFAIEDSNTFVERNDMTAVHADLARLYAHFLPSLPKRPKTAFDWCAKAMSKDDVRHYLRYVYVTDEEIMATDGHRLHIAPNADNLEPGFYGAEGVRLHPPSYSAYPDTKRVRPSPDADNRTWYTVTIKDLKIGGRTSSAKNEGVLHWYELPTHDEESPQRVQINKAYFDALVSMDPNEPIRINTGSMSASVLVELSGGRLAVMMPLRQ